MTDNHIFELEDNDEDFVIMPDEVMSAVEAAAEKKGHRDVRNDENYFRAMV